MRGAVTAGRRFTHGGWSHSCERPTRRSPRSSAQTISVAEASSVTTRRGSSGASSDGRACERRPRRGRRRSGGAEVPPRLQRQYPATRPIRGESTRADASLREFTTPCPALSRSGILARPPGRASSASRGLSLPRRPGRIPAPHPAWPVRVGASRPSAGRHHEIQEPTMTLFRTAGAALRRLATPALFAALAAACLPAAAFASELDLQLPSLEPGQRQLLIAGLGVCVLGMLFGLVMFNQVKGMPAHKAMLDVSNTIYETCKAYLLKQGQLLVVLELFIGACIVYYFGFLQHLDAVRVLTILAFSVLGILGSYGV